MQIPGYELQGKIGEGGTSTVWRARQVSLNRMVALKVILPSHAREPGALERFRTEGLAAAQLSHRNIVQVYDAGTAEGTAYFAMELVEGHSLGDLLAHRGALAEKQALSVAGAVAEALAYAWERARIVHCDIKPDNILIGSGGVVKVADLGLARIVTRRSREADGVALGTPNYVSPEQAAGEPNLDFRSDIYSLGATLYHMVTGVMPFAEARGAAAMDHHIDGFLPDPQTVNPAVTAPMAWLLEKMMRRERKTRYFLWAEVVRDLHAVLQGKWPEEPLPEAGDSTVARQASRRKPSAAPARAAPPAAVPNLFPTPKRKEPESRAPVRVPADPEEVKRELDKVMDKHRPRGSGTGPLLALLFVAAVVAGVWWFLKQERAALQPLPEPAALPTSPGPAPETVPEPVEPMPEPLPVAPGPETNQVLVAPAPAPTIHEAFARNPLWSQLVAYQGFDDANGAMTAADETGNDHVGRYNAGVIVGVKGQVRLGVDFNRMSTGTIRVEKPLELNTNTVTVAFWLQRRGTQAGRTGLVLWRENDRRTGLYLGQGGELRYSWNDDLATFNWRSGLIPKQDAWVLVALVVEPTRARIFLGVPGESLRASVNAVPHAVLPFAGPLLIGQDPQEEGHLDGRLDEMAIWRRALAPMEINELFLAGQRGERPADPVRQEVIRLAPPAEATPDAEFLEPIVPAAPVAPAAEQPRPETTSEFNRAVALYNNAMATYQQYLNTRANPEVLRRIEANLEECIAVFEKQRNTPQSGMDAGDMIDLCNKLRFQVHGTIQVR